MNHFRSTFVLFRSFLAYFILFHSLLFYMLTPFFFPQQQLLLFNVLNVFHLCGLFCVKSLHQTHCIHPFHALHTKDLIYIFIHTRAHIWFSNMFIFKYKANENRLGQWQWQTKGYFLRIYWQRGSGLTILLKGENAQPFLYFKIPTKHVCLNFTFSR